MSDEFPLFDKVSIEPIGLPQTVQRLSNMLQTTPQNAAIRVDDPSAEPQIAVRQTEVYRDWCKNAHDKSVSVHLVTGEVLTGKLKGSDDLCVELAVSGEGKREVGVLVFIQHVRRMESSMG